MQCGRAGKQEKRLMLLTDLSSHKLTDCHIGGLSAEKQILDKRSNSSPMAV
jgi:hypothetical protein